MIQCKTRLDKLREKAADRHMIHTLEELRKESHKTVSLYDMRNYYGSTRVKTDQKELLGSIKNA